MPGKMLSLNSGPTVLLSRLCEEMDFEGVLNRLLRWDPQRSKLSPGTRIKALVMNILTGRDPLYKVEAFYRDQDVELLFGPGVTAQELNDDALARALDKLHEASPWTVYSTLALHAVHPLYPRGWGRYTTTPPRLLLKAPSNERARLRSPTATARITDRISNRLCWGSA